VAYILLHEKEINISDFCDQNPMSRDRRQKPKRGWRPIVHKTLWHVKTKHRNCRKVLLICMENQTNTVFKYETTHAPYHLQ